MKYKDKIQSHRSIWCFPTALATGGEKLCDDDLRKVRKNIDISHQKLPKFQVNLFASAMLRPYIMSIQNFTRMKNRTTYFRRKVPTKLQDQIGLTEISYRIGAVAELEAERLIHKGEGGHYLSPPIRFCKIVRSDEMLTKDVAKRLLRSTLEYWASDNDRMDAQLVSKKISSKLGPVEEAQMFADLAAALGLGYDKQQYGFEDEFVAERMKVIDEGDLTDPTDIIVAKGKLTLALAVDYYRRAIALIERHGLENIRVGFRRLEVSKWQSRLNALQIQLELTSDDQYVSPPPAVHGESIQQGLVQLQPAPATEHFEELDSAPSNHSMTKVEQKEKAPTFSELYPDVSPSSGFLEGGPIRTPGHLILILLTTESTMGAGIGGGLYLSYGRYKCETTKTLSVN